MRDLLSQLDGSPAARVAMLAGVTREELEAVGGAEKGSDGRGGQGHTAVPAREPRAAVPPADTPLRDEVPSVPDLGDGEAPFRFFR